MAMFGAVINGSRPERKKIPGISDEVLGALNNQAECRMTIQVTYGATEYLGEENIIEMRGKAGRRCPATGREKGHGFLFMTPKGYFRLRPLIKKVWGNHPYRKQNELSDLDKYMITFYEKTIKDVDKEIVVMRKKVAEIIAARDVLKAELKLVKKDKIYK